MEAVNLPPDVSLLNIPRKPILLQPRDPEPTVQKQFFVEGTENEPQGNENEPQQIQYQVEEKSEVLNEPKVIEEGMSEEQLMDSIPYDEWNVVVPMPYFPIDTNDLGLDEFHNKGSVFMDILRSRATEYLQSETLEYTYFASDEQQILPALKDCKAVIFQLNRSPIAFDEGTRAGIPGINLYGLMCSLLDEENEPIYVLTDTKAYQVTPAQYLETYKEMFPLNSSSEEEEAKKTL
jgi:hypothetical protein